jgi:hypothetical protein
VRKIKSKVRHFPIMHVANDELFKNFEFDASNLGWGEVLKQVNVGRSNPNEEIIQFALGTWLDNKKNYATIKFETYLINNVFFLALKLLQ